MLNLHLFRQSGLSLIELMVVLAILAIVAFFGLPGFSEWAQNTQIRATTESLHSGLQLARSEAVRRNTGVEFRLSQSLGNQGATGWTVIQVNGTSAIQSKPDQESSARIVVTTQPADADMITFDGTGRGWAVNNGKNRDGTNFITQINIDSAALSSAKSRNLRIDISALGGQIRMCDPNVTESSDPRKCP